MSVLKGTVLVHLAPHLAVLLFHLGYEVLGHEQYALFVIVALPIA
jgi:hypothetical protein